MSKYYGCVDGAGKFGDRLSVVLHRMIFFWCFDGVSFPSISIQ
ncbi:MAG: hypothetical protein SWX82_21045 [Cyanobacteriota bacterium]|nr:hypothetical protein [Cyanobacteriota bacterium]MDY7006334.1 hypothetical protein [Cyanobacteriota bacterium]